MRRTSRYSVRDAQRGVAHGREAARDGGRAASDTGSFKGDLQALALEIAGLYQQPRARALVEGVVAAAVRSPEASTAWATVIAERNRLASRIVERAVERGELPPGTDGIAIISAVGAPIYYRLLVARGPVDDEVAEVAAAAAYAAALSGAFTPGGSPGPS